MSEPLSNHEIEDVVSSIRRLVSAEPRTRTRDLGFDKLLLTPALRVVPDVQPEPLVLATAVQEPQAPASEASAGAEILHLAVEAEVAAVMEADMPEAPDTVPEQVSDPVSEPLAALDTSSFARAEPVADASAESGGQTVTEPVDQTVTAIKAALVEPEAAEAATGHDAASQTQADAEQAANLASSPVRAAATLHLIDAEWEDEIWEEPEPTLAELAEGVEDAELVSDAADGMANTPMPPAMHNPEQPVPFFAHPRSRTPADLGPVSDRRAEEPGVAADAIAEPVVAEAVSAEAVVAEAVSAERVVAEAVSAEPATPEPVIIAPVNVEPVMTAQVNGEPVIAELVNAEPVLTAQGNSEPVIAEPVIAAQVYGEPVIAEQASDELAVAAPEPVAEPRADVAEPGSDEMALAIQAEEAEGTDLEPGYAMVDEDVLHEIVRDLIREELQGALGERITRNVRKLVRAEINRALASRPYE